MVSYCAFLVPMAVFLAMTLVTWAILSAVAERPKSAEDRLKRLLDPAAARGDAIKIQANRQDQIQAKVTAAANKLGKSLRPSSEAELGKIRLKLVSAGFRHEQATAVYYGLKLLGLLLATARGISPTGDQIRDDANRVHQHGRRGGDRVLPA